MKTLLEHLNEVVANGIDTFLKGSVVLCEGDFREIHNKGKEIDNMVQENTRIDEEFV